MEILFCINMIMSLTFMMIYLYQYLYLFVGTFFKPKTFPPGTLHRYAVLIAARNEEQVIGHLIESIRMQDYPRELVDINEEQVIGHLIESIRMQDYPRELVDIYVAADNCTDNTAASAAAAGAFVGERFDDRRIGKGYALSALFHHIYDQCGCDYYDGFFVFDADNLLEANYITEMNKVFSAGYRIVTSYRNSKNYSGNWISAGYALWFIREAVHLNNARMILGTSCGVSGTGFLFHRDIAERNGGWKHYLLTEDIEFTVDSILHGEKIGYCHTAVFYDEQPQSFAQSWRQRLRWARGYLQVFRRYGFKLIKGAVRGSSGNHRNRFACFDMSAALMPALVLSVIGCVCNIGIILLETARRGELALSLLCSMGEMFLGAYVLLFVLGIFAAVKERKQIRCPLIQKIVYQFTFPLFLMTYVPITCASFFKKVQWKPIRHTVSISLNELQDCGTK